ncbi:Immunity protein 17 [Bacteroides luti]|uniref:Immunity protein 17 n=1 Tax=Bacteroides luti TaxID=1297750 RepID=A0A1M5HCX8_9BACE|nr:immunity 17 family protein [Bacteroides luti]SHG13787.1 Immunity protein 17 [Bacteroides luti]
MNPKYVVQGLFIVAGIISILAALFNWNWFFSAQNAQFIVRNIGRKWARVFYGTLGLILIAAAVFFYFQVNQ